MKADIVLHDLDSWVVEPVLTLAALMNDTEEFGTLGHIISIGGPLRYLMDCVGDAISAALADRPADHFPQYRELARVAKILAEAAKGC